MSVSTAAKMISTLSSISSNNRFPQVPKNQPLRVKLSKQNPPVGWAIEFNQFRVRHGVTQWELAFFANSSVGMISRLETGLSLPTEEFKVWAFEVIPRIANGENPPRFSTDYKLSVGLKNVDGAYFRQLRKKYGVKVSEISLLAGCTTGLIYQIELGNTSASPHFKAWFSSQVKKMKGGKAVKFPLNYPITGRA